MLPAEAHAKISCRLVGTQDAHKIRKALRARVEEMLPADCTASYKEHGSGVATVMSTVRVCRSPRTPQTCSSSSGATNMPQE